MTTLRRWIGAPRVVPDPRVAVLANELRLASLALARAAEAMKHLQVTPFITTTTRSSATRAEHVLMQMGILDEHGQPTHPI